MEHSGKDEIIQNLQKKQIILIAEIDRLKVEVEMNRSNGHSFFFEESKFGKNPKISEYEEEIKVLNQKLEASKNSGNTNCFLISLYQSFLDIEQRYLESKKLNALLLEDLTSFKSSNDTLVIQNQQISEKNEKMKKQIDFLSQRQGKEPSFNELMEWRKKAEKMEKEAEFCRRESSQLAEIRRTNDETILKLKGELAELKRKEELNVNQVYLNQKLYF